MIGDKRRWRQYKARVRQLPPNYRMAVETIERYLMYFVLADGDAAASMFEDLADLFEQAAADGTPVREIVGEDPVEYRRGVRPELLGGWRCPHPWAEAADRRHRARRGKEAPMTARTTSEPAIRVQGLEKSYQKLRVLRGVDFDVARGSIFALLGSNGAGKTTTVKILSTLLKADAGTATVDGFDVAAQPANVRESISLTGQFAAVDETLTGRENLVLVARLRHLKGACQIAADLLARFQLTDAAQRRVSTYSGGMRRRLDIAMSLIGNPPVIFLDEPTTGLDPESRLEVWNSVKQLAGRGTAVLLTTQYLDEAEQLADRIAILHQGRIIANGTLAELKQLLPPAQVEYVEKQPSLEDIFLAITGSDGTGSNDSGLATTAPATKEQR